MVKRIAAIGFIFVCTSIAWAILGVTIFSRTYSSDEQLRDSVETSWGAPQTQTAPTAGYTTTESVAPAAGAEGKGAVAAEVVRCWHPLPLEKTRANVGLHLDYRQKGLLWYSSYRVEFAGDYWYENPSEEARRVTFTLHLPAEQAIYDNLIFSVNGEALPVRNSKTEAYAAAELQPGEKATLHVQYESQGLERWAYDFGGSVTQVRDFQLRVTTNFAGYNFPEATLSPTEEQRVPGGRQLDWKYASLVSGYHIGIEMPEKLQPGPLAGRISFFAPVSLLFFFFVMFVLTPIRGVELHPMNYFFLACAFFSFHLLLAYLVDHISVPLAFVICSGVSVFLVVSYLRIVAGLRFAAVEAGLAQFIYLVLFSYAFFFKGFTGLTVTIGAILTLFATMQMTARVRWGTAAPAQEMARSKG
ncbi:MAG TPA: inner membrane CreD family protein [Verrucomicrobiae bacterium]|nr:inner membrane CreD family protein [Verrucomicrobiae bacterium]